MTNITENTLRNGLTVKEALEALDFELSYVIIEGAEETITTFYVKDSHADLFERLGAALNRKVTTIEVSQKISITSFTPDPQITIVYK